MDLNNGLRNVPVRIEPGQSSLAPPPFNNNNNNNKTNTQLPTKKSREPRGSHDTIRFRQNVRYEITCGYFRKRTEAYGTEIRYYTFRNLS